MHTKFGKVSVSSSHCLAPKGKQGFRTSPYCQELACLLGQALPFDEASVVMEKLLGHSLSDKQIERLCHHYGQALESIACQEPDYQADEELHYALMDGSMVFIRQQGWREIKLGRVFAVSQCVEEKQRGTIRESKYVAHLGKHGQFLDKFDHLLSGKNNLIAIGDGARWIWDYWNALHPEAHQILDYYHVVEKLGQWVVQVFTNPEQQKEWMELQQQHLLNDQAAEVVEAVATIICRGDKQKQQTELLTYLRNNLSRMYYKTYRNNGWYIGSGAIEAANRNVVQKRLKLSGQRWTPQGLQQVANLRVAYLSNLWENLQNAIRCAA